MQLTEKHIIDCNDPRFSAIDAAAFKSKNLYNATLYEIRQSYIFDGKYLNYNQMDKRMKPHEAYKALPAKVAQQVLKQVDHDWDAFFKARKAYKEDPSKFTGRPRLPKYKGKTTGRNLLVYTLQALRGGQSKKGLQGDIEPSGLPITVKTLQQHLDQVRIVPRQGCYVVEVVYTQEEQHQEDFNPTYYAGIDLGINNLVTLASNKPGFVPVLVNGRPVKSTNQYYNKKKAHLQSTLRRKGTSRRMERLTNKRNRRIEHYMHTISCRIVDLLVKEGIGTLIIGKNDGWKQRVRMGKRNNQNFVSIPHARLITMLTYKAHLVGIRVVLTEESYTSKASLLDLDPLPMWNPDEKREPTFSGKRITRGLYRASDGRVLNADVNGAGNMIRKVVPNAFGAKGIEDGKAMGLVVHPVRFVVVPAQTWKTSNGAS